jgi:L-fuculose-phosphate aldolase
MLYPRERQQVIDACLALQEMGYFLGTWGNVSLRLGEHILLTPSRVDYDTMTPQDMVVIDLEGNRVEGHRNPTSEKEVHRRIYRVRQDVRAIIHAHTEYAMAASAMDIDQVPCLVEEMSQLLGGSIPLARAYVPALRHEELGAVAASAIGSRSGVLLRNHGPVGCGKDLREALLVTKVMEKACKIFLSAQGPLMTIPDEFVQSERYRYLYTYGKEKT